MTVLPFGRRCFAASAALLALAGCDRVTNYPGVHELPPTPVAVVPAAPPAPIVFPANPVSCDPAAPVCGAGEGCCERCCRPGDGPVCLPLVGGGCPLPDLTVDQKMLQASVAREPFTPDAKTCPEALECLGGTGPRQLLRFTTAARNDGTAPFFVGKPAELPELFHWSDCEQHWRQGNVMEFRLKDTSGNVVATGHKAGFCLMDDMDFKQTGKTPTFNCADQGISPGWADLYGNPLDCQWVDVTGVKAGDYTLEVEINADHRFLEGDYQNNVSTAPVHLAP